MTDYQPLLGDQPRAFLDDADEKTERVVKDNLAKLREPYPGQGRGDKEEVPVRGDMMYRLHVGRSYTALYTIDDDEHVVRVREILPIDEAHDKYGFD